MPSKVLLVFGTRPEAIKMLPLVRTLRKRGVLRPIIALTGQHRSMVDQVLAVFGERADIDLNLMQPNQTLASLTSSVIQRITEVIHNVKPDVVLVHGDTTTALAAAMASFYSKVMLGHVEAGLRSFDVQNPWPEEFNRIAIDTVADYMFAPTKSAADNIEKSASRKVIVTGNTGIDAVLQMAAILDGDPKYIDALHSKYDFLDTDKKLILVTGHRRESFGDGFDRICAGLLSIVSRGDCEVVYPVHLNPSVREPVRAKLSASKRVRLLEPVDYHEMVYLMRRSHIILTDSGGVQEEAPALGKPVLVMRDVTERPEAVSVGAARLVGTDPLRMRAEVDHLLTDVGEYNRRAVTRFPYGDGKASVRISEFLEKELV